MSSRKASVCTARFIPGFLAAIVAYVSYVVVGPLAINYLIKPPRGDIPKRNAIGIAIPIVHFVLLIPVFITWLRLLLVVLRNPGYTETGTGNESLERVEARPGLEYFWKKDVFVCDPNGIPIWCDKCQNWKPDRAHHSQDVGRCTRKMDHFCPWVGGVVGERAMKFFVQFLVYSMILTAYLTIVLAYFVAEYKGDVQIIVALALSGFFLLFTLGMVMNSVNLVMRNTTTIENVAKRMYLAVVLPPDMQRDPMIPPPPAKISPPASDIDSERPLTSELDDPSHLSYFARNQRPKRETHSSSSPPPKSKIFKGTITYPLHLPVDRPPLPAPERRTFAILHTPPGLNPWDLGRPYRNFTQVFGSSLHEWVFPIKNSPCCDHSSMVSDFPLGPEFELLLVDAGLIRPETPADNNHRLSSSHSKRLKRRLDPGWQNGERPDGWVTENEARRLRSEWKRRAKQGGEDPSVY